VQQSLWDAVEGSAVAPKVLLDFVQVFESEVDFTADTREGDQLRFLVEAHYADGVRVDYGRILAAQYLSDGRMLTGVGFKAAKRFAHYDLEGRSLKKAFLRSPLKFTRISSRFTYRRPHPILGGVRPHLAIDYAAPSGTPVWAIADGIVQFAGRKGGNGIQVLLRHRSGYKTYYNHLSRIARGVRRGARVSQKQVIGYVGSTGLSTGPHLDYRVSHHGKFVNPLSERFVPGKAIAKARRAQYLEYARALVERLEKEAPFPL
jgi:murein DD-endopeptidase MepM/ murein hydrolase activator NlpD